MTSEQLALELRPSHPNDLSYFVTHSGVAEAAGLLDAVVRSRIADPETFRLVYLWGPVGSGKTHLILGTAEQLLLAERPEMVLVDNHSFVDEKGTPCGPVEASRLIAEYERLKREGGVLLIADRLPPLKFSPDPHISSRMLGGGAVRLDYPREDELKPLLLSISERHNLRLSEASIRDLVTHLPRNPLSLNAVFDSIDAASLAQGRSATRPFVRRVLKDLEQPAVTPEQPAVTPEYPSVTPE